MALDLPEMWCEILFHLDEDEVLTFESMRLVNRTACAGVRMFLNKTTIVQEDTISYTILPNNIRHGLYSDITDNRSSTFIYYWGTVHGKNIYKTNSPCMSTVTHVMYVGGRKHGKETRITIDKEDNETIYIQLMHNMGTTYEKFHRIIRKPNGENVFYIHSKQYMFDTDKWYYYRDNDKFAISPQIIVHPTSKRYYDIYTIGEYDMIEYDIIKAPKRFSLETGFEFFGVLEKKNE